MVGYHHVVSTELTDEVVDLSTLDFNYKGVRHLEVLRGNDKVILHRQQDLDLVQSIAQVMTARVETLLLHYLVGHRPRLLVRVQHLCV